MKKPAPEFYGIRDIDLAAICHISLKTAQRWKSGTTCPPDAARILVGLIRAERIIWPEWTVRGDVLISPEGWEMTKGDVMAARLLNAQLATYQAELRKMRGDLESMDEQPNPDEWQLPAIAQS